VEDGRSLLALEFSTMMRRLGPPILLLLAATVAHGETPSPPPHIAAYDGLLLRQAGVGTDAASALKFLHDCARGNGNEKKINILIEQLGHADFEQRERASKELIAIGRPALERLRKARKTDDDPEVRLRAVHCIDAIENRLDANLVFAAVRWVIHLRASGAAELLLDLLPDVDWETQDEIFHGLPQVAVRDGKLDPALLAALQDKSSLRRAAAALAVALAGTDADRERVRKLLTDTDATVRLRAAQGLLAARDPASLPVLIALLNEPQVDVSWSAEELLHWVADRTAPAVSVGAASADERKKAVTAWTQWHREYAAKIDWDELAKTPRRPGLCFVCDSSRVWLCGCDGKARWTLPGELGAHDIVLLPDNQLVIAPVVGEGILLKHDLSGKELWKHVVRLHEDCIGVQRLPNGHFFAVTEEGITEIDETGKQVAARVLEDFALSDAWMLRNGHVLLFHDEGVAELDGFNGPTLRDSRIEKAHFGILYKFAVLRDGRCVVPDQRHHRLFEVDAAGRTIRTIQVRGALGVAVLRNGNYLVSSLLDRRIVEVDPEGRAVWEAPARTRTLRLRVVLDKLRIGFDKPRPADFSLDSVASRVRGLKDADASVRQRAAEFLGYLRPTDEASIAALVIALDDAEPAVRSQTATTLGQIGEPAMPALIQTLKKGTANSRVAASDALYRLGPTAKTALPELIGLVSDNTNGTEVRCHAAATIGRIGAAGKEAVPALLDTLKSGDDPLRQQAALALAAVAPEQEKVVNALIVALKDEKYPTGRHAAMQALTTLGPAAKTAIPDLLAVVKSTESPATFRKMAVEALGNMRPEAKNAVPALLEVLKDKKQPELVRSTAARNLGRFGDSSKTVLPVFGELLRDPDLPAELAGAMVNGLGTMGKDGVPGLADAVKQGNSLTRRVAISQLGELGNVAKPALPALQEAAKDKDPVISRLANRTIRLINLGDSGKGDGKDK
jgi:HEAT repeat protein